MKGNVKSGVRRFWSRGLNGGVVAAVVAALVAAGAVVAASPFVRTTVYKQNEGIRSSFKAGSVDVPPNPTPIATLRLPKGKHAVFAKLYADDQSDDSIVTCRLGAGSGFDMNEVETEDTSDYNTQLSMSLQVVTKLRSRSIALLTCEDNKTAAQTDAKVRAIRLTAIESRKLANGVSP